MNDKMRGKEYQDKIFKGGLSGIKETEPLRKIIFSYRIMQQEEAEEKFTKMDTLMNYIYEQLLKNTTFAREEILSIFSGVYSATIHGKVIFEKEGNSSTEYTDIFRKDFIPFLQAAEHLYSLTAWEIPISMESLRQLHLLRSLYEDLVIKFLEITKEYEAHCSKATLFYSYIHNKDRDTALSYSLDYSAKMQDMEKIEQIVGGNRSTLTGVVRVVKEYYNRYLKLRDDIMCSYLKLNYSESKNLCYGSDSQMSDNFQNGLSGMIKAIGSYCSGRGMSFASFARVWIRQAILQGIRESRNSVRIPNNMIRTYMKAEKVKNSVDPRKAEDTEFVAKELNITEDKLKDIYDTMKMAKAVSIESPADSTDKGNDLSMFDSLEDTKIEEEHLEKEASDGLSKLMLNLDGEEYKIVCLTYGMFEKLKHRGPIALIDMQKELARQAIGNLKFL